MNEFIISVNDLKKKIKVEGNYLLFNDKKFNFELQPLNSNLFLFKLGDKFYEVYTKSLSEGKLLVAMKGRQFEVIVRTELQEKAAMMMESAGHSNHHVEIKSPMPGLILKFKKKIGEEVEAGEPVLILEAMKMENELRSPAKGKIKEIFVKEGIAVEKGVTLFMIE
ncbi:MAG TPA: acetyl-CoA carboxylase biotin carboxyl carrier protein subunit [Ignavibacteriaceae bacterium]|nr:acetyl-CoA carboxylase biotin carboxyl carrier protein subunit [Ignavibacteriaceae bacterium]